MKLTRVLQCTKQPNGILDDCLSSDQIAQLEGQMHNTKFTMNAASSDKTIKYSEVMAEYSQADFSQHFLYSIISQALLRVGIVDKDCRLHQIMANCNRFGDYAFAHIDMHSPSYYSVLVYANRCWQMEWGGETYFCNENKEVEECVIPKPGRIAIFPSNVWHIAGVPRAFYRGFRYTISARYELRDYLKTPT